jgi:hypothetical protein
MISPRISIPSIVLAAVLLTLAIGAVAVHASPACQRLVHTYITVPVRNRMSKATAMAWAKWRVGHPNWKPNPKVQRPRYVMTREEAMDKVDFACETPAIPFNDAPVLTPRTLEDSLPIADLLAMSGPPPAFPDGIAAEVVAAPAGEGGPYSVAGSWPPPSFSIAPYLGSVPPSTGAPSSSTGAPSSPPIVSSESMPIANATPEPPSLLLVASGLGAGRLFFRRRPGSVK